MWPPNELIEVCRLWRLSVVGFVRLGISAGQVRSRSGACPLVIAKLALYRVGLVPSSVCLAVVGLGGGCSSPLRGFPGRSVPVFHGWCLPPRASVPWACWGRGWPVALTAGWRLRERLGVLILCLCTYSWGLSFPAAGLGGWVQGFLTAILAAIVSFQPVLVRCVRLGISLGVGRGVGLVLK